MVSVYTPNINLEEPARGDQVGTWDTPVNANMTLIDLVVGGTVTIPLAGAPVVLAAAQFQAKTIVFSSTLTASVVITFPTSFTKSYEIFNQTTGSSQFVITLQSTVAGANAICCPPGEVVDVANIGGSIHFKNLGRVGSYWDHGGSSVPNWVSGCTVPPYLLCDGTAFSSTIYPNLRNYLGVGTVPDARGRARYALDAGVGRVSSAASGVAGNTIFSGGGDQNMPTHAHGVTDPGHVHDILANAHTLTAIDGAVGGANTLPAGGLLGQTFSAVQPKVTGLLINNQGTGNGANMPPVYIGGITLIRSA